MPDISRRELMKLGAKLAAVMGLGASALPRVADALQVLTSGAAPVLWLQAQSCSGCSVTILNADQPGPAQLITQHISLKFHQTLSAATGEQCVQVVNKMIELGGYYLVVEGTIPAGMPRACVMGGEPLTRQVVRAASAAQAIIAQGTCAAFGGIPAAEGNPTGAMGVVPFLKQQGIAKPTICLPGCPPHPDWVLGTLVHLLKFGLPPLDAEGRPKMFYSKLIHDQCPRFADYERENFAKSFSDDGCLFKLGCMGPNTHADCTLRNWNSGVNCCIKAGAPCIGCASREFAARITFPFYRKGESEQAAVKKEA